MATRVSPRSNASSASSSSSASRRAYRNPSFNRDRDNTDPWVSDGRGIYQGKQQHLHQQHNKGQWGHKSNQAVRAWGNSGTQIAEKTEESRLSWRSQKQAVDKFSSYLDSGPPKGVQQPYRAYEPLPFLPQGQPALHTVKGYRNQASPREQSFYSEQSRPAFYPEQSPRERHQPNFTKQDHYSSGKITHVHNSPASNTNHSQGSRGPPATKHQGFRDDPLNRSQGSGGSNSQGPGYSTSFSQGSRYAPGNSSRGMGGEVRENSVDVANRGWNAPITRRHEVSIDKFPPLTNRSEAGPINVQAVGAAPLATNKVWGGTGAIIGSWADECSDDAPQTSAKDEVGAKRPSIIGDSYKVDWENSDVSGIRRSNANNNNHRGPVSAIPNKDTWRQNSRQGSNFALAGDNVQSASRNSWRNQESSVKQEEGVRNTSFAGRHGSFKHTMSVASEQRAGAAGDSQRSRVSTQNHIHHVGRESKEESVRAPDDQVLSVQGDAEGPDDAMLPFIMGTCEDMCPLKEREQRERLRDLAVFERVNGNPSKTSRELAVKKFCRTFSGVKLLSADVRPLRILWSTLQYLLNLLDDSEFSFDVVHNFLFDRTRAIRQELGMQRIANSQAINMYEEIVRFHILSEHELNQRGAGRHVSDSHLNLQQLSKSLLSLFDLYRLNHHEKLANEAEFRAYYVLLNLDSNRHHQADSLSVWFRQCPAVLLNAWELKFARAVLRCYRSGNYRNFFQLAQEATFLQSCLMEIHFNEVRLKGLAAMNQGGYKLHPIPLADIAKQLLLKEGDLEELCNLCGLSTGMDTSRIRCLLVKQSQFSAPKELPSYRCACIVNKQPSSHYAVVTGTNQRL